MRRILSYLSIGILLLNPGAAVGRPEENGRMFVTGPEAPYQSYKSMDEFAADVVARPAQTPWTFEERRAANHRVRVLGSPAPAVGRQLKRSAIFGEGIDEERPPSEMRITEPSTGVSVRVTQTGQFEIFVAGQGWTFRGNVGRRIGRLQTRQGEDAIGTFQEIFFNYLIEGYSRTGRIRLYKDRPAVVFDVRYIDAQPNTRPFARFTEYPDALNHFSYTGVWGHAFGYQSPDSPALYFDDAGNSFMMSPLSHFPVARTWIDHQGALQSGIDPTLSELPEGYSQQTMLVFGKGINQTFETWGQALMDLYGKKRPPPDADVLLEKLSYWTDAVARYYYSFEGALGYEGTLKAMRDEFSAKGIPLGSMQLDSWWYKKGNPPSWRNVKDGIYELAPDPDIFPQGLAAFRESLGLPLMTHARWLDPQSPIRDRYRVSGNVSIDPQYWKDLAAYLKASGVTTYEQDWLDDRAAPFHTLTDAELYLDQMAEAMKEAGLTLQYRVPRTFHFLQGAKYGNLTSIRVSSDGFGRDVLGQDRWEEFFFTSRLASALGIPPFADNVRSADTMSLLLATLSSGPVGLGDALGQVNEENLKKVARADGVIVKPDAPIVPLDQVYLRSARDPKALMLGATHTDHAAGRTAYVFAYQRGQENSFSFKASELGMSGDVYVYNMFTKVGTRVTAGSSFADSTDQNGSYYIAAPVGKSGIAFLGDAGKFASVGKQRIAEFEDTGTVSARVTFAPGEKTVTLQGYSPFRPRLAYQNGTASLLNYDPTTGFFQVAVFAGSGASTLLSLFR